MQLGQVVVYTAPVRIFPDGQDLNRPVSPQFSVTECPCWHCLEEFVRAALSFSCPQSEHIFWNINIQSEFWEL